MTAHKCKIFIGLKLWSDFVLVTKYNDLRSEINLLDILYK